MLRVAFAAKPRRHGGFSFVELIAAIAIMAVVSVSLFSSLSFALAHQSDGIWQAKTTLLAESYLAMIAPRRFDETTPLGGVPICNPCSTVFDDGEARALYDDIDDFHGIDDQPPLDEQGAPLIGFDSYRVQVQVRYPDSSEQTLLGLGQADQAKVVVVTVTPPGQSPQAFTVVRTNF